ncbi:MAG: glycosyltransferase family 39 protein [Phycisphaerales bacterium]|nr:MAG: glycosyltransferase family 39 protein [Phycisphaerales bacterium]
MDAPTDIALKDAGQVRRSWIEWVWLGLAGVVLILFRLHAFDLPLETDECNYIYIGGRLLDGDRLYIDVWDHQPFGVFALFAGVIALFGDGPEVFRWLAVVFSLVSILLINGIVRLTAGRVAAGAAVLLFAISSADPGTAGEGCNREIYMNTLILAAWLFALRSSSKPGWGFFLSGCALAVGSCIKTILAVHWLLLAVWIAVTAWQRAARRRRTRSALTALGFFAAGPIVLWLATFGYYAATQRFGEFIDAVFLFNLSYSESPESFFARFARFFAPQRHPFIFDSAFPLWIGGGIGSVLLIFVTALRRNLNALAALLLVLGSYLATCLPARFWPHYYYLLVPAMTISLSIGLAVCVEMLASRPPHVPSTVRKAVSLCLFAIVFAALLTTEYKHYLSQPPFGITVTRYNSRDFWGRAQSENVRRVTEPGDEVFVYSNEAEIYYYSKRRCASRYTMITGIRAGVDPGNRRRATMMEELREDPPRLIMVLFDDPAFDRSSPQFDEVAFSDWQAFLNAHYGEPVGWDFNDRTREPIMFVLARKDQPIEKINWDWDRKEVGGWNLGEEH